MNEANRLQHEFDIVLEKLKSIAAYYDALRKKMEQETIEAIERIRMLSRPPEKLNMQVQEIKKKAGRPPKDKPTEETKNG